MLKEEKSVQDSKQTQVTQAAASQSVQEFLEMQRVLHEINLELFRIDDMDKLYRTAVELAHTRLGFERVGMYLLDDAKKRLLGTYGTDVEGNVCSEQGPEHVIDQKETIDTYVLGRSRLVATEEADLFAGGEVVGRGWHIGAAMWLEDSPIGVIFADNLLTGQPLKSYQPELLFAYASNVSNLIERNRFERIITKRAAEMQAVAEVSTAVATILNTDELLQEVVNLTKNRFDLYHAHIYLLDAESETLVLTSGAGKIGRQMVSEGRQIPLKQEQSLVARAARSRQGVVINDVQADPGFLPHPLLPDTRAEMAVPLITGEQVLGVLDVQSDRLNYFSQEDISTFTTLAVQTAVALQNARLYTQSEVRAEELTFVNRIVTRVNALDTAAGLQFLAEELGEILQIPSIVIGLIDETGTMLGIAAAHHPAGLPTPVGSVFPLASDPIMGQALQTRQTVVIEDVAHSNLIPQAREAILKTGTRSMYIIPMIIGRDLIGTVSLNVTEGGSLLTPDQLKLAETIVYQAATAVQNARLFAQVQTAFTNAEQSEAALSEALRIAKLAYWEYDVEKDLFTFNDQFFALFHSTAEAHGGYQLPSAYYAQHFVHPEDLPIVGAEIERALTSTDRFYSRSLEHRILYTDGGVGYISVSINIERDEEGKILRYYGANQDITERKKVEETLRQSETELSEALKIAKLGYWEYDVEKDLFTFNDQFFALFHTTAEAHGGYQLPSAYYAQHFVHPEDTALVGAEIERALHATDRTFTRLLEHRILYADGGLGYILVNINIERDEEGKILRWYGANQDITERKLAEEARRQSEAELSEALKIAKLAYWEYDVEKDLFTFNDQFFALFHTTIEDHGGYQLPSAYYAQHFVHPEDLPIVGAEIERALTSTDPFYTRSVEHRILYADGGVGYMSVNINIQRDEEGKVLRYYGANQDITERREAQETIARRAAELETVANVSAVAATILEPEELLQQVVDLTKERFHLYHAHIYLLDPDTAQLTLANGAGDVGRAMVAEGRQIALSREKSLVARAARAKRGVVINDVQAEPGFLSHPLLPDTRAEMAVPLIARDEVLGVLDVQADRINRFMEEDINIFTTLAAQIAIALQNAWSLNQSEKAVKELQELSRRLTREGWQDYFSQRKDRLVFSYDGQQKTPVSEVGAEPVVFAEDARLVTQPLQIQGASVGQLRLEMADEYDEDEAELLTAVLNRLSTHIENLRLSEESEAARADAEQRSKELAVINEVAQSVSQLLEPADLLETIFRQVQRTLTADAFIVALYDERTGMLNYPLVYDSGMRFQPPTGRPAPDNAWLQVVQTGTPRLLNRTPNEVAALAERMAAEATQRLGQPGKVSASLIFVPLFLGQKAIGALSVQSYAHTAYTERDLALLEGIANHVAVALENARLYTETQHRAEREALVNSITQKIQSTLTVEKALETAVNELGRVFQAPYAAIDIVLTGQQNGRLNPSSKRSKK